MVKEIENALVRIRQWDTETVFGTGFAISRSLVVTCTHVVADALNVLREEPLPIMPVLVDIPFVADAGQYQATVLEGCSMPCSATTGDVTVLKLNKNLPDTVQPALLVDADNCNRHEFETFGFPEGFVAEGRPAFGVIADKDASGRLNVQGSAQWRDGLWIEPGFSGAPVWDVQLGGMIGMVVAQDEGVSRSATIIPTRILLQTCTAIAEAQKQVRLERKAIELQGFIHHAKIWYEDNETTLRFSRGYNHDDETIFPYNDKLNRCWDDFRQQTPWHIQVNNHLLQIKSALRELPDSVNRSIIAQLKHDLDGIDISRSYPILRKQLQHLDLERYVRQVNEWLQQWKDQKEVAYKFKAIRYELLELLPMTKTPHFSKAFLLMGEMGSGKSAFLDMLMAGTIAVGSNDLLLPLHHVSAAPDIATVLLDVLCTATGREWQSLEEFDNVLNDVYLGQSLSMSRYPRVFCVIDDLHQHQHKNSKFIENLLNFIQDNSHLHNFYWVITDRDTAFTIVIGEGGKYSNIWTQYGSVNYTRHSSLQPANISGWLALDQLNQVSETGLKIIRSQLAAMSSEKGYIALDRLDNNFRTKQYLNNPFIAKIWLGLIHEISIDAAVDLNYIQFIKAFWGQKLARQDRPENISSNALHEFVDTAAKIISEGKAFTIGKYELIQKVANHADSIEVKNPIISQGALECLVDGLLIESTMSDFSLTDGMPKEIITLRFEAFWASRIAQVLVQHFHIPASGQLTAYLEHLLAFNNDGDMHETLLQFFLLVWQESDKGNPVLYRTLFDAITSSQKLPHSAIWFAAGRAPHEYQSATFDLTKRLYQMTRNERQIFAFLYFIGAIHDDVASALQCMRVIEPLFQDMARFGLGGYFLYLFRTMLQRESDPHEIVLIMKHLSGGERSGCESLGVTEQLADVAVQRLFACVNRNVDSFTQHIMDFLKRVSNQYTSPEYLDKLSGEHASKSWYRYLFREWVMEKYFEVLSFEYQDNQDRPQRVYGLLQDFGWYNSLDLRHNHWLQRQMEQEANIALGKLYYGADDTDFLTFIEELACSTHEQDKINAFHIIRHTKPTHGDKASVKVDKEFQPVLETLFLSKELTHTIDEQHFLGFFQHNLEDFDSLNARRQQKLENRQAGEPRRDSRRHNKPKRSRRGMN